MNETPDVPDERPESFWHRVYLAVIVTTVVVITLLWAFSRHFGS